MHLISFLPLLGAVRAARPYLEEPDTGIEEALGDTPLGTLPPLEKMFGLNDLEWAAKRCLNATYWSFFRAGAGGEWSYRNNLEAFARLSWRPRVLVDIVGVEDTLATNFVGTNYSAPFFLAPFGRAGYANDKAELNLVQAAADENILYIASMHGTLSTDEIVGAQRDGQQLGFQFYNEGTDNDTRSYFRKFEAAGAKAIFFTVDSAGDGNRHRAARYDVGSSDSGYTYTTWDYYNHLQNMTSVPIVPKGIQSVSDARTAVARGAPAIYLSNHGARQLDGVPSPLEVALDIHAEAPELFEQVPIGADGGVRYGSDVLKLLALGCRGVGVGRPIAYANMWGVDGVRHAIQLLKHEIAIDAANMGLPDVQEIDADYLKLNHYPSWNGWYS